ncbi:histidine--tRNA ligase [Nanoarchaeota archaeon]
MKTETVKGFKDFTGSEAQKRAVVREVIRQTFERYGFLPVETPIIEYEEFVKGDNEKDEAVSDIFKLQDKGKRKLALRYEFTFQLKRLMKNQKLPFKRYQIGPVFRDEPVSANRFRQFTQCDVDTGGATIKDEAEIIALTSEILKTLKIDSVIYFNNRKLINEILDELKVSKKEEVIREIDKLDKLSEKEVRENLKKLNAEELLPIIKKDKSYFKKYSSFKEIEELEKYCRDFGVKAVFVPSLARGLSYYNRTVYEVKTKKMEETIVGGGSYIFNDVQFTGISFGLERVSALTNLVLKIEKYLVVSLNKDKEAISLANKLRKQGKNVTIFYGKPSKALEYANSYGIKKVIFVGAKEVKQKKFRVKNMINGRERFVVVKQRKVVGV